MADSSIKIKLAVDKARNCVLFADAGPDLVDVLLSFLTLPLSAVRLDDGASSLGCLSTLCQGVSCLRESKLLRFDACHDMLLRPRYEEEFRCGQVMVRVAHVFSGKEGAEKFVNGNLRFVIGDDLVIKTASTANTLLLLQRIDSGTIDQRFEEIEVCIGWTEVVSMLRASFSSKTVFTDTFLSNKTEVRTTVKLGIAPNYIQHPADEETDASPQISIKVFYDSLDNLYGSAIDLDVNSALGSAGAYYNREMLLDPSMAPFLSDNVSDVKSWFCLCRAPSCGYHSHGNCTCLQFVKDATYIVDDDLLIYQASAMLVMKHWCNRGKDRVLEMDIDITKQEAVDLLRATLTSKTALSDVFKSKLEDKCKLSPRLVQNHFQIFVKLHTGKTITLDVENHDTIATVKNKISEKAGLQQLPAGYPYHLVYGNRLRDSSTVADCNIGKGSTIHFAVYMGGGN